MTCDECKKLFEVKQRVIHSPDTDGVLNIKLETDEPIGHHQFLGVVNQWFREESARYQVEDKLVAPYREVMGDE